MFHLLVSYKGWKEGGDAILTGRIYIKANEGPSDVVLTNGKLDAAKVNSLPAVLMTEIGGSGPKAARIAYIQQIVDNGRDTSIQYSTDARFPPIDNADLQKFSAQLGIRHPLNHTHWEVCQGDLFRIMLMVQLGNAAARPHATVFSTAGIDDQQDDLVSVMMPFGKEFDPVLTALQTAAHPSRLRCQRADDIWVHHHVIQDIVDLIAKARVVVCDCTGKNPNVFYEIGIAHALGKDVIFITQSKNDIPFDLQHLRYVPYFPNTQGLEDLTAAVQGRLKTLIP
jgi:hypothetical protein